MQMRRGVLSGGERGRTGRDSMSRSAEDTVLAKLQWYREGGGAPTGNGTTCSASLKVQGPTLDRAYLREWAHELDLTDLLRRALDDAGSPREACHLVVVVASCDDPPRSADDGSTGSEALGSTVAPRERRYPSQRD